MSDQVNPFEPPKSDIAGPLQPDQFDDASMGARFLNLTLDMIARIVLSAGFGAVFGAVGGTSRPGAVAIALFTTLGYYVFFETLFGRTPGKLLTGTLVVNETGENRGFAQIVGRSLAPLLSHSSRSRSLAQDDRVATAGPACGSSRSGADDESPADVRASRAVAASCYRALTASFSRLRSSSRRP
jgi:hypothetical protein